MQARSKLLDGNVEKQVEASKPYETGEIECDAHDPQCAQEPQCPFS